MVYNLSEHPRKDGIKAAIKYLKSKRKVKPIKSKLDDSICYEALDVGILIIFIVSLISIIFFK